MENQYNPTPTPIPQHIIELMEPTPIPSIYTHPTEE